MVIYSLWRSFEPPNFDIDALEGLCAGQALIREALCFERVAIEEVTPQKHREAALANAATYTETSPVAVLIHGVVPTGIPHLTLVAFAKGENEVLSCSVEARIEDPFFSAETAKFIPFGVLNNDERRLKSLQLVRKRIHRHTVVAQTIEQSPFHVSVHAYVLRYV